MDNSSSNPGLHHARMEKELESLPDRVADALEQWEASSLKKEQLKATLFLTFKGGHAGLSVAEANAKVIASDEYFKANLDESKKKVLYKRLYERLMTLKKIYGNRIAY